MASGAGRTTVDRLGPLDRIMLGASRRWPQDIGVLAVLDGTALLGPDGELRVDVVRDAVGSRLSVAPRLRQVIRTPRRGLGGPLWVDADHFDVREHVLVRALPPGAVEGDLPAVVEGLRRERLDPSTPGWRLWLLPGLPHGRVGLYLRLHHTIADGMATMHLVTALMDPAPGTADPPAPVRVPAPPPSTRDLLADAARARLRSIRRLAATLRRPGATLSGLRAAWPGVRELFAERPATRTSLDREVGPRRTLEVLALDLDEVRAVGHAHGATVNDVLLAGTAGGLRAVLEGRGEPTEDVTLRTYVPVSLRLGHDEPRQGNRIAQMAVPLPMRATDPHDELRGIAAETTLRKARAHTPLDRVVLGRLAFRILLLAVLRQRVNITTASIPGPTEPLALCGARVLQVFPVLPLVADEPLGVGAVSYAGVLGIGVVADPDVYPDLAVLVAGVEKTLRDLGLTTRPALTTTGGAP